MTKTEFLLELTEKLSVLPMDEIEDRWGYYSEMIDDLMEDGMTEEEAVAELGAVEDIAAQILADIPLSKLVKEKIKKRRHIRVWEIVLLVLGSPIWFTLLIAVAAVVFSIYISLWAIAVSLWAVFAAFAVSALSGIAAGVIFGVSVSIFAGIAVFGLGFIFAGLAILMFFLCLAATKGLLLLTKKMLLGIKHSFVKRRDRDA